LKIVFCCAKPWPASNANAAAQPSAPKRTDIKTLRDMRDPAARTYKDTALTPVGDDEEMTLNLLTDTTGAPAAVMHLKKIAKRGLHDKLGSISAPRLIWPALALYYAPWWRKYSPNPTFGSRVRSWICPDSGLA
jgi:hypothetical protein